MAIGDNFCSSGVPQHPPSWSSKSGRNQSNTNPSLDWRTTQCLNGYGPVLCGRRPQRQESNPAAIRMSNKNMRSSPTPISDAALKEDVRKAQLFPSWPLAPRPFTTLRVRAAAPPKLCANIRYAAAMRISDHHWFVASSWRRSRSQRRRPSVLLLACIIRTRAQTGSITSSSRLLHRTRAQEGLSRPAVRA